MYAMFQVRSARTLAVPARFACPLSDEFSDLFSTRQGASSFNQPLSFDTFSVGDMEEMFAVRSHALTLSLQLELPVHVWLASPQPQPSPLPARTSSVGRELHVQHKQAADSLRMGGKFDLRLCWL